MKTTIKHSLRLAFSLGLALLVASCGSKRAATYSQGTAVRGAKEAVLAETVTRSQGWTAIKATLQGRITTGSKDFSSRINLSAVRSEGIRLSAVPFPLIEAARLWFTPEGITLVDLIHDRYAQESYEVLSDHLGFTIDYDQIEALLLGQVFVPGAGTSLEALEGLRYDTQADGHKLSGTARGHRYAFVLSPEALLRAFIVYSSRGSVAFDANYTGAQAVDSTAFPSNSTLTVYQRGGESALGSLSLEWRSISSVSDPTSLPIKPNIRSSYERIGLDQILKILEKQ